MFQRFILGGKRFFLNYCQKINVRLAKANTVYIDMGPDSWDPGILDPIKKSWREHKFDLVVFFPPPKVLELDFCENVGYDFGPKICPKD